MELIKNKFTNGTWNTKDTEGKLHTLGFYPSFYRPESGFSSWEKHGIVHNESGCSLSTTDGRWNCWSLDKSDLKGRLLLW